MMVALGIDSLATLFLIIPQLIYIAYDRLARRLYMRTRHSPHPA